MGKRPFPEQEELEFIISCILDGCSYEEIRDKLKRHGPSGKMIGGEYQDFAERSTRTLTSIKRVVDITKKLLRDSLEKEVKMFADPVICQRRQEHWDDLVDTAEMMYSELGMPSLSVIPQEELARGYLMLPPDRNTGWILSQPEKDKPAQVSLSVEENRPLIFNGLITHLQAEYDNFDLGSWKENASSLLILWQTILYKIEQQMTAEAKIPISVSPDISGFSAAMGSFLIDWLVTNRNNPNASIALETSPAETGTGLFILHPEGRPAHWLARGNKHQIKRAKEVIYRLADHYASAESMQKLAKHMDLLDQQTIRIREMLSIVCQRRTFQGTCNICSPWSG